MTSAKYQSTEGSKSSNTMCEERGDVYKKVTTYILEALERVEKSGEGMASLWARVGTNGRPRNALTGEFYSGVNVLNLWIFCDEHSFTCSSWLTFIQARSLGGNVRKGAKGAYCVKLVKGETEESKKQRQANPEAEAQEYTSLKGFFVFNIDDIEGLQAEYYQKPKSPNYEWEAVATAETIAVNTGATFEYGGNRAFFRPSTDTIHLPLREKFPNAAYYHAVQMHELTHWTGGERRLNRGMKNRFGSEDYAFEELVAEIGAAFVMGSIGLLPVTLDNHAQYLSSWLQALRDDKKYIFKAAAAAQKAYDYLLR